MYFKNILYLFVLINCAQYICAEARNVAVTVNPQCPDCDTPTNGSFTNLVWVKLQGQTDELHFMYSTIDSFSIMLFRTNLSSNLTINWTSLRSNDPKSIYNSIKFSPVQLEMAGYSIPTIYEFNDQDGVANMSKISNNESYWVYHKTEKLIWDKYVPMSNTSGSFVGKNSNGSNGTFKFNVRFLGVDNKRDINLPHLLMDSQSSAVDLILDSLEPTFKDSKFGVNMVMFTTYQNISSTFKKTLDDEYTPGTFNLYNIETLSKDSSTAHNFLQWKPIFYFSEPRKLENSTITLQYDLKGNQAVPNGLGAAFYNNSQNVFAFNVSFGLEGNEKDGYYYTQTNYSVWSFSVGLGAAPDEKMSFVVSLVIAVGFGLPALVIVVGLLVLMVRKLRSTQYSEI